MLIAHSTCILTQCGRQAPLHRARSSHWDAVWVFGYNLPSAPLAQWPGSFTATAIKHGWSGRKLTLEKSSPPSPASPAGDRTRDHPINSSAHYHWAICPSFCFHYLSIPYHTSSAHYHWAISPSFCILHKYRIIQRQLVKTFYNFTSVLCEQFPSAAVSPCSQFRLGLLSSVLHTFAKDPLYLWYSLLSNSTHRTLY